MAYRSTQDARRQLLDLAATQGGYFTAKQAASPAYGKRHIDYHVRAGNFERVERGLFRLPTILPSAHDDLIRLNLWSRGRDDVPAAVVSHETALGVHGLGDLLPARTHLTVPPGFRKRAPAGCVLHKQLLSSNEIELREGFRVTTPVRTVLDVARDKRVTQEQLEGIIRQATREGAIRPSALASLIRKHPEVVSLAQTAAALAR
ncbi:MAG TPA: type IV toxin-antitoxin system AbiEi family antitoxin domain-containing protein [Phycisphaerae bacterium]|mgnify:CR=1 FL=1|nr:type IV toxin-antitoxin system AbiEi family antitoxin domain-containing protein [Phycisphaerae bacterium]